MIISPALKTMAIEVFSYFRESATDFCTEIEQNNHGAFAVLVSAKGTNALRKAYPNYLADTKLFVEKVDTLFKKHSEKK